MFLDISTNIISALPILITKAEFIIPSLSKLGYANEIAEIESVSMQGIDLGTPCRTALDKATLLLESPYKIWHAVGVREQQKLFYFIFDERLAYSKKAGYRTDNLLCAVRLFEDFVTSNTQDVEMGRIELPSELGCLHASTVCSSSRGLSGTGMRRTESCITDPQECQSLLEKHRDP